MSSPVLMILALLALPADGPDVRDAAEAVLADESYQRELPAEPAPGRNREPSRSPSWLSPAVGRVFLWFLVAVLVVGAVLFAVWIVRDWEGPGARRAAEREDPKVTASGGSGTIRSPEEAALPDPAALAGAGRYEDAVHALLLHAIRRLVERHGVSALRDSLTSREILSGAPLPAAARQPFHDLIVGVERGRFGRLPTTAEDYERAADRYRAFRGTVGGRER